jgi:hypothetical protein
MKHKQYLRLLNWLLVGAFLLSACNFPLEVSVNSPLPTEDSGGEAGDSESPESETQATPTEEPPLPTDTPEPTPTATEAPPTNTPEPTGCTNVASFVSDVTYPDDTEVDADSFFTKTWRLRNDGSCTWTSSYALVFSHGDQMGGPAETTLAGAVPPGSTVDISSSMTAPTDPGTYQGFWKLRSNDSVLFGVGTDGSVAFWVKIVVPDDDGVVVFEPLAPVYEVYIAFIASGTDVSVNDNGCFDLDDGEMVGCGTSAADFRYEYTHILFTHDYEINPLHSVGFKLFGSEAPTRAQCQALSLSPMTFDLHKRYYCYHTSDGYYGWIKIENFNSSVVLFDFATFNEP